MPRPRLLILHAPECSGEADRVARAVARHWPEVGQEPVCTTGMIGGTRDEPGVPVIFVLGPEGARPHTKDLNAAWDARRPAVVLCPRLTGAERELRGRGMLVEALDFPPAVLAGSVYAMLARQCVVDELAHELRAATVSTGGVGAEIERLQEEMHLAASVQRDLLPRRMPRIEGVDVGLIFRPAGFVSGDIYDVEMIDDRYLAFFVADAVGHGVPAALMTMVISQSLRRLERRGGAGRMMPPCDVLRCLNGDLIRKQQDAQRFATAVYGILDTHTNQLTVASAGHPSPLLLARTPGGPITQSLDTTGPLLGIFDDAQFDEVSRRMAPGETLLVYSDGFETAFPRPGEETSPKNLPSNVYFGHLATLAGVDDESLSDSLARLEGLLDLQHGSLHQADDITALAIAVGRGAPVEMAPVHKLAA
jgi:hypothetical protein